MNEQSRLIAPGSSSGEAKAPKMPAYVWYLCSFVGLFAVIVFLLHGPNQTAIQKEASEFPPLLGISEKGAKAIKHIEWPKPIVRCDYVINVLEVPTSPTEIQGEHYEALQRKYEAQSTDPNVFYRATAKLFWEDFGRAHYKETHWTSGQFFKTMIQIAPDIYGDYINLKSTWTWITGDQHLSNFGAYRNRHGDIVFGVNDFDEGALFDFQLDVLRCAVSIADHAFTNGFKEEDVREVISQFGKDYLDTVMSYVGNDRAGLFELTPKTTTGHLKRFLSDLEERKSTKKLMRKFTHVTHVDPQVSERRFIRSESTTVAHNTTHLAKVDDDIVSQIKEAFTETKYGATRMKLGWKVRQWDDDFFTVLDVAARIGSGIGSYGVDRYYVLLKGEDHLLKDYEEEEGGAIILDVKYQPPGAVRSVLSAGDAAWYDNLFAHSATRVVFAEHRLTSYADPYLGWIMLGDRPFGVRQRSPWKKEFDMGVLVKKKDLKEYLKQVAIATATAHVRGTQARAPADFKSVISKLLDIKDIQPIWLHFFAGMAMSYRQQVLADHKCFQEQVQALFGTSTN